MQFCGECNNLLYPKEKRMERKLVFVCRHCNYETEAKTQKIYTNEVQAVERPYIVVHRGITFDPALPRTNLHACPKCGNRDVCFFQSSLEDLSLVFVCCDTSCLHQWKQAE